VLWVPGQGFPEVSRQILPIGESRIFRHNRPVMKVDGPGKTGAPSKTSKTKKSSGASGAGFSDMVESSGGAEESAASSGAAGAAPIQNIDALLALQERETGDDPMSRARARARAEAILDELDKFRIGLLNGVISRDSILQLARLVASHKQNIMDPRLAEVLDEIDLRAQVELAKLDNAK